MINAAIQSCSAAARDAGCTLIAVSTDMLFGRPAHIPKVAGFSRLVEDAGSLGCYSFRCNLLDPKHAEKVTLIRLFSAQRFHSFVLQIR
jgi:hypothetical protein